MASVIRWALRHKVLVIASWLVFTLAGAYAAGPLANAVDPGFAVPGREGWETNEEIAERFWGTGGDTAPLLAVVRLPKSETVESPTVWPELQRIDDRLQAALRNQRLSSVPTTEDAPFVSEDLRTTYTLIYPESDGDSRFGANGNAVKAARTALNGITVAGQPVQLTGFDALLEDAHAKSGSRIVPAALVGGLGALALLTLLFGPYLAMLPISAAGASVMTAFLLLLGLTEVSSVSTLVPPLVALTGIGQAMGYSLLIVTRWREVRSRGNSGDDAVQAAMEAAGGAVVVSGLAVAIGLFALVAIPVPFMRSIGWGGMLITLVSTLVALTLLPVVLAKVGSRPNPAGRHDGDKTSRAWMRWAKAATRQRRRALAGGMALVLALAIAATDLQLGSSDANTITGSGESRRALTLLRKSGIGEGALLPHELLVDENGTDPYRLAAQLREVEGIHGAVFHLNSNWQRGGIAIVEAIPVPDSGADKGEATLAEVREVAHAAGPDVRVGGQPAANRDFIDAVYNGFPLAIVLMASATFIVLARAFRSLLLPLEAISLTLLSIAATWGVLVLVWQHGYGSEALFGIEATGSIPAWMPPIVFAFLFALFMGYVLPILSRVREEYDRTGSTEVAAVQGVGRTGRLVAGNAVVFFVVLVTLACQPGTELTMLASALAAGLLIDGIVIRALIIPTAITLIGRWNWWLPKWLARPLRVEPSPLLAAAEDKA
jgi:RND superfamily putative drug exporter